MEQAMELPVTSSLDLKFTRTKSGRIKIRKLDKARIWTRILLASLFVITIFGLTTMDFGTMTLGQAIPDFASNLGRIFLQPRLSHRVQLSNLVGDVAITLGLAIVATTLGAIVSFFFSLLAARNLSPKRVTQVVRATMSFIRAIPAILWVLIFALAIGLGAEAAIVGLVFQGIAFLTKAYSETIEEIDYGVIYSETIEEIDYGVIEALKASGATWWQIVFQAVVPSCLTAMLSWTFIRLESNFGHAIVVGAAAGAGGIGFQLVLSGSMQMDMREVGVIIYLLIAVSVVFELISMKLRERLLVKS